MRCCFIFTNLVYCILFCAVGGVFVGLYSSQIADLNGLDCSVCNPYGATQDCGFQLCCIPGTFISYSYSYCSDNFVVTVYLVLFLAFFAYGIYELVLMIGLFCRGSVFSSTRNEIVIVNTGPTRPMLEMSPKPITTVTTTQQRQVQMNANYQGIQAQGLLQGPTQQQQQQQYGQQQQQKYGQQQQQYGQQQQQQYGQQQ